jgi:hypothetical protein
MTARSTPYPPPGFRVRVPAAVWSSALDEVRRYATLGFHGGRRGSEGLVYFAGVPAADAMIVTAVYRMDHEPQGDRVMPMPEEVRWLLSTLRERDEKLIAQLHTHRYSARHSLGDDRMATSFHDGFLSIVAPNFAVDVERIDQCVVHQYDAGTFRPLSTDETVERFTIYAQIVDRPPGRVAEEPNRWHRYVRRLKSIVRRRH